MFLAVDIYPFKLMNVLIPSIFLLFVVQIVPLTLKNQHTANPKKLVMIAQVFRHGARYPEYIITDDNSFIAQQQHSYGQLTAEGKSQQYLLGTIIRRKYWQEIFRGTEFQTKYNQSKFYVRSSFMNRTIQSAQAHMFGLLEGLEPVTLNFSRFQYAAPHWKGEKIQELKDQIAERLWDSEDDWFVFGENGASMHTIPIHTESFGIGNSMEEVYVNPEDNCPVMKQWGAENIESQLMKKIQNLQPVREAFDALRREIGNQTLPFDMAYKYIGNKQALMNMGYPTLAVFSDPKYKEAFQFIHHICFQMRWLFTKDQILLHSMGMLDELLKKFQDIAKDQTGNLEDKVQFAVYSGHDSSVSSLLTAFQLKSVECLLYSFLKRHSLDPKEFSQYFSSKKKIEKEQNQFCLTKFVNYSHVVVFQLWRQSSGSAKSFEYTIKMAYNGQYLPLFFCKQNYECTIQEFRDWVSQFTKGYSFAALCTVPQSQAANTDNLLILWPIIMGGLLFFSWILLAVVCMKYLSLRRSIGSGI